MPEKIPQRTSILTQTIEILRDRIGSGEWGTYLPSEHELAQRLQVGRNTIRKSLIQLTNEKIIEAGCSGKRRLILASATGTKPHPTAHHPVIFLSPYPQERLPAITLRQVDEIRPPAKRCGLSTHADDQQDVSPQTARKPAEETDRRTTPHLRGFFINQRRACNEPFKIWVCPAPF